MFERPIHLNRRGSFIPGYDDIVDECIKVLMRNLGKHISSEMANRLRSINQCSS